MFQNLDLGHVACYIDFDFLLIPFFFFFFTIFQILSHKNIIKA